MTSTAHRTEMVAHVLTTRGSAVIIAAQLPVGVVAVAEVVAMGEAPAAAVTEVMRGAIRLRIPE